MGSTLKGKHSQIFETCQRLGLLLKKRLLKYLKPFKVGFTLKEKTSEVFETFQRFGLLLKRRLLKYLKPFKDVVYS